MHALQTKDLLISTCEASFLSPANNWRHNRSLYNHTMHFPVYELRSGQQSCSFISTHIWSGAVNGLQASLQAPTASLQSAAGFTKDLIVSLTDEKPKQQRLPEPQCIIYIEPNQPNTPNRAVSGPERWSAHMLLIRSAHMLWLEAQQSAALLQTIIWKGLVWLMDMLRGTWCRSGPQARSKKCHLSTHTTAQCQKEEFLLMCVPGAQKQVISSTGIFVIANNTLYGSKW